MKAKKKPTVSLIHLAYPAGMAAAFIYLSSAGAIYSAIVASAVGVVGWAYGLASK
jgi:hypothetical protein